MDYKIRRSAPFHVNWVNEWVSIQPLRRRPQKIITSAMFPHQCLQYPEDTTPEEWSCFWCSTRKVVFDVVSGLKHCCPHERSRGHTFDGPMDDTQWATWVRDVLWTFHQLIRM